jgi:hypothetical protein
MFLKRVVNLYGTRVNEITFIAISKVGPSAKLFTKSQTHMNVTCRSLIPKMIQIEK